MIQFGEFTLDIKQARLLCQEAEIAIEPKLFELLLLFINQPDTIISRQDILDSLWAGSLVTDNAINKLVANLRRVLADDPKNPHYIQTVPKRGYRLICKVTVLDCLSSAEQGLIETSKANEAINNKNPLPKKYKRHKNKFIVVLLLVFCSFYLWQILTTTEESSRDNRSTIGLTRAHGAEQSARMHPDNKHLYYLKRNLKINLTKDAKKILTM